MGDSIHQYIHQRLGAYGGGTLSVIMRSVKPKSTGEGEKEEEQKALKSERRCRDKRRGRGSKQRKGSYPRMPPLSSF